VQITADAQAGMLRETLAARESISGVNLDEEAANLIRYQQAYQASGKVLQVATLLFDTILEISP
jgi:flagellar hook-associated protein 1 FlgK